MSGEPAPAAAPSEPQPQASELQPGAPAPADGGAAPVEGEAAPEPQPQPAAESDEDRNKKRERFDRRFSDLSRAAREAELRAARLEGELNALRQRPQSEPAPQAPAAPAGPPNPKDYPQGEFDSRYITDLAKHELREEMRAEENRKTSEQRARAANEALQSGAERLRSTVDNAYAEAEGDNGQYFQNAPRFLEVAAQRLPIPVVDAITESRNPIHVAEILGRGGLQDEPLTLEDLKAMGPVKAARAIERIDTRVSMTLAQRAAQPAPAPRPAPQPSPQPIPTVTATGAVATKDPANMSFEEFQAYARSVREASARANGAA